VDPSETLDVVVVGGVAAGLSAALVLARARRRVVVVDAGRPRNGAAGHVHGFLSRDGARPAELLAAGRREVLAYGGQVRRGVVTAARPRAGEHPGRAFDVELADGDVLAARRLLICTGLRDELPDVPGLAERWGRDVLHCPYCHGHEVAERAIGVLGTSSFGVHQALLVRRWSDRVVFFQHEIGRLDDATAERLAARDVDVVTGRVQRLHVEDDALRGVALAPRDAHDGGVTVPLDALFVAPRFVPNDALVTSLGCDTTRRGWVETDDCGLTDVPGVWAAGNLSDPGAQLISSAGDGGRAAVALDADLLDEDLERAVEERRRRKAGGVPAV
jgi:thioredoxin reductase